MGKVKALIRYILDAQNAYAGTGMMMALYFVALLIIAFYCKEKRIKRSIVYPTIVLLCVPYIAVPIFNTMERYLEFFDGRLFWILITPIVIAVGLTLFVVNIDSMKARMFALLLLIPIFMYSGMFKISDAMYKRAENQYRLPQVAVSIAEHILSEKESPRIIVPYTIAYPFRQISTDIYLMYGEDASSSRITGTTGECYETCREMEKTIPDLKEIIGFVTQLEAAGTKFDYIIFDTVYTEFCENGNININGYPIDENYVGDRTPSIGYDDLVGVKVIEDEKGIYWDLSHYGLTYDSTFGQYIIYSFDMDRAHQVVDENLMQN